MTKKAGADTGGQVLTAAAKLFREHGVAGASIRAIADAADVLPGSVTYRYATKEALVVALMQRAVADISSRVFEAIEVSSDPVERLAVGTWPPVCCRPRSRRDRSARVATRSAMSSFDIRHRRERCRRRGQP